MADVIRLQCTVCERENYTTSRNKKQHANKIEKKKYCRWDRKHTLHKEAK